MGKPAVGACCRIPAGAGLPRRGRRTPPWPVGGDGLLGSGMLKSGLATREQFDEWRRHLDEWKDTLGAFGARRVANNCVSPSGASQLPLPSESPVAHRL